MKTKLDQLNNTKKNEGATFQTNEKFQNIVNQLLLLLLLIKDIYKLC
jgi:hypothetical protein